MGLPFSVFAQQTKIIDVQGQVLIKKDKNAKWEKAEKDVFLGKDAEIKTKGKAQCLVSFGDAGKRVITVQQKTDVKIESVEPGSVYLSKGRVFALIKDLSETRKFEVKTPTAIAGARGTGWSTEYEGGKTAISCFDDVVYVASLDKDGNIKEQHDVSQGFEVSVDKRGEQSEARPISEEKKEQWQGVVASIEMIAVTEAQFSPNGENQPTTIAPGVLPGNQIPVNTSLTNQLPQIGSTAPGSIQPVAPADAQSPTEGFPAIGTTAGDFSQVTPQTIEETLQQMKEFNQYLNDHPEFAQENPEIMREYGEYMKEQGVNIKEYEKFMRETAGHPGEGTTWEGSTGTGPMWGGSAGTGTTWEGNAGTGSTWEGNTGMGSTWEGSAGTGSTWEGPAGGGPLWEGHTGEGTTWEGHAGEGTTWEGRSEPMHEYEDRMREYQERMLEYQERYQKEQEHREGTVGVERTWEGTTSTGTTWGGTTGSGTTY